MLWRIFAYIHVGDRLIKLPASADKVFVYPENADGSCVLTTSFVASVFRSLHKYSGRTTPCQRFATKSQLRTRGPSLTFVLSFSIRFVVMHHMHTRSPAVGIKLVLKQILELPEGGNAIDGIERYIEYNKKGSLHFHV